jgi:hypothetical protein
MISSIEKRQMNNYIKYYIIIISTILLEVKHHTGQMWLLTSLIPATWEAEVGGSHSNTSLGIT